MEELEDRRVLATFTVNTLADLDAGGNPTTGSLRAAINAANENGEADEIIFEDFLFDSFVLDEIGDPLTSPGAPAPLVIQLNGGDNGGELVISEEENLTITGPAARVLSIQAAGGSRVFAIDDGNEVARSIQISGLTISGGGPAGDNRTGRGGGIYSTENLTLSEVVIQNNTATEGGGVFSDVGALTIERSLLIGNSAFQSGGGVYSGVPGTEAQGVGFSLSNSTLTGNSAGTFGGGVYVGGGTNNDLSFNTIYGNSASTGGGGVASYYNPAPEDMETPPVLNVLVTLNSNIIANNGDSDVDIVPLEEEEGEEPTPDPVDSMVSAGFNIIQTVGENFTGALAEGLPENLAAVPGDSRNFEGMAPGFILDEMSMEPIFTDWGGATNTFHLSETSIALDAGDPMSPLVGGLEQRGNGFFRVDPDTMLPDIGATERQRGEFLVDTLVDEADGKFIASDLSLREALRFSTKNPLDDAVTFSTGLQDAPDPTFSPAPTILLDPDRGPLRVNTATDILGLTEFVIEIDGGDLVQVFRITNADAVDFEATIDRLDILNGFTTNTGGAIFNDENLTISNSTIRDSFATNDGGGIYTTTASLVLENSTVTGNFAADEGGGLFFVGDGDYPHRIVNSTISGNNAGDRGGAILNDSPYTYISYSTITLNSSGSLRATGIGNLGGGGLTITSSIVSNNQINNDVEFFDGSALSIVSGGYNLVGGGNAIFQFLQIGDQPNQTDPMLSPLINSGGPTATHFPLVGSPVIDSGNPNPMSAPLTDQRGVPFTRLFDGNEDGTTVIDIGAYELQESIFTVDNPGSAIDGNFGPDEVTLPEAIQLSNLSPLPDDILISPAVGGINIPSQAITDDVDIESIGGTQITGFDELSLFVINDNDEANDIDVSFTNFAFQDAVAGVFDSRENLTLTDVFFTNNDRAASGGAITQNGGSLTIAGDSTITGSTASGPQSKGGAIYANGADVNLDGLTVAGNNTIDYGGDGGGVAILNGTLIANDVTIAGNSAPGAIANGAGIFLDNTTASFADSTIASNTSTGSNAGGAGLYALNSEVTIENTTIAFNTTLGTNSAGGGVQAIGGSFAAFDSIIGFNSTAGLNANGGGISANNADVSLVRTALTENDTLGQNADGGGLYSVDGAILVRDSLVGTNAASGPDSKGGGIFTGGSLAGNDVTMIVNSTISGNVSLSRGGGIFNSTGLTTVLHSTIAANSVPYFGLGGGVASVGDANTLTEFGNSIVADNFADINGNGLFDEVENPGLEDDAADDVNFVDGVFLNSVVSLGYNIIESGIALPSFDQPGDQPGIDPMIGVLANNGGQSATHELLPGSPALGAGDPNFSADAFVDPLLTDQRGVGFPRVFGDRIDIGAFESQTLFADSDADDDVDIADLLGQQRGFGMTSGATPADGDANRDGAVDGVDQEIAEMEFGSVVDGGGGVLNASASGPDADGDGDVDLADLLRIQRGSGGGDAGDQAEWITAVADTGGGGAPAVVAFATAPSADSGTVDTYSAAVLDAPLTNVGVLSPEMGPLRPAAVVAVDESFAALAADSPQLPLSLDLDSFSSHSEDERDSDDEDAVFEALGDWIV